MWKIAKSLESKNELDGEKGDENIRTNQMGVYEMRIGEQKGG